MPRSNPRSKPVATPPPPAPKSYVRVVLVAFGLLLAGLIVCALFSGDRLPTPEKKSTPEKFDATVEAALLDEIVRQLSDYQESRNLREHVTSGRVTLRIVNQGEYLPNANFGITYFFRREILLNRQDLEQIYRTACSRERDPGEALKLAAFIALRHVAHELFHFAVQTELAAEIGDGPVLATLEDEILAQCSECRLAIEIAEKHPGKDRRTGNADWDKNSKRQLELFRERGFEALYDTFGRIGGRGLPRLFAGTVEEAQATIVREFDERTRQYEKASREVTLLRAELKKEKDQNQRILIEHAIGQRPPLALIELRLETTPKVRAVLTDPVKFRKMVEFYRRKVAGL